MVKFRVWLLLKKLFTVEICNHLLITITNFFHHISVNFNYIAGMVTNILLFIFIFAEHGSVFWCDLQVHTSTSSIPSLTLDTTSPQGALNSVVGFSSELEIVSVHLFLWLQNYSRFGEVVFTLTRFFRDGVSRGPTKSSLLEAENRGLYPITPYFDFIYILSNRNRDCIVHIKMYFYFYEMVVEFLANETFNMY